MKVLLAFVPLASLLGCLCQDKEQKKIVCKIVGAGPKAPVQIETDKDSGLKVLPFNLPFARDLLQSATPALKNFPMVDSADGTSPLPVETSTKNVSVTCEVVSTQVKDRMNELRSQVAKLNNLVEKLESNAVCPGGVTYLDRCFRLMEIRGKTFSHQKAEDLCDFSGGVLARFENSLDFSTVASYVQGKFSDPKYDHSTTLQAWTGMKYEIPTVGIMQGPFSPPNANQENERLNKIFAWFPGFPRQSLTHDRIALQFRYSGPDRSRITEAGAANFSRKRRFVPLCQFQMKNRQKPDLVSARLFRFNF